MKRLRVMIVNDSATMRASLKAALSRAPDIEVVSEVEDGRNAAGAVEAMRPDVVLMDVVMPNCDGYQATRAIMSRSPTPVVMVTAAANPRDEHVVFEALGAGALGITQAPPPPGNALHLQASAALAQLVRTMAGARVGNKTPPPRLVQSSFPAPSSRDPVDAAVAPLRESSRVQVVGIVASAGGPSALVNLLCVFAKHWMPPILVVQHISRGFTAGFAGWLSQSSGCKVTVPEDAEPLEPNVVYLAPEDAHLGATRNLLAVVSHEPPVGVFRPSGDYLLMSLARAFKGSAVGIVLSGMGQDGAAGAVDMARSGGVVITQDADSADIDGMPRAVRERVPSAQVHSLDAIAPSLVKLVNAS